MNWFRLALEKLSKLGSAPQELTEGLFLRLLGLVYFTAFGSWIPQILPLIGSRGVTPAARFLHAVQGGMGRGAFFQVPTLFWIRADDPSLKACCWIGCLCGICMLIGLFTRTSAFLCWILYLSVVNGGQPWSNFQWDALLLECGFLALFSGAPLLGWAYRLLLFRLMFESGVVKLQSHDIAWHSLHALRYHFMTQPIPNPLAYYAHRLPDPVLDALTLATLFIELVCPFALFGPRLIRQLGTGLLMVLQIAIVLTGNYAFFNLLTLALCLWGFDDRTFEPLIRLLKKRSPGRMHFPALQPIGQMCLLLLISIGLVRLCEMFRPASVSAISRAYSPLAPFELVNNYGLFAVMTTTRPEVIIEGSDDLVDWREYTFRYKPGPLHRGLPIVAPYQPRLDWQMWFAALGPYQENTWVGGLMYRLLTGDPGVTALLEKPPFSKPPHYMRASLYDYQFTTSAERSRTGAVWQRKLTGNYFGPVSLNGQ
jgi:lipase maturation factor 1